jgi:tetratricopeptide (TPR) repeat protein
MRSIFFSVIIFTGLNSSAQSLKEALALTENENYEQAELVFKNVIQKGPAVPEWYYYFGENFFKRGETDSAMVYYRKGMAAHMMAPINYVGAGKWFLSKSMLDSAARYFYQAKTLSKDKNAEIARELANAWLETDTKNPDKAIESATLAIKLDPKNALNYLVYGDALLEKNPTSGTEPIKQYQLATQLNSKSPLGIIREGKLYKRARNYKLALEKYEAAKQIDSTFAPAYSEKAELFFLLAQNAKSVENWKKYLALNNSPYARQRFIGALYSNKQFEEAVSEGLKLKASGLSDFRLDRILAYAYEELGSKTNKEAFVQGLQAITNFFNQAPKTFKFIAKDYRCLGYLLIRNGKDSLGILEINKALQLDPNLVSDTYSRLAKLFADAKLFDKSNTYYRLKMNGSWSNINLTETYDYGKLLYAWAQQLKKELLELQAAEASKKPVKGKPNAPSPLLNSLSMQLQQRLNAADSAFSRVAELKPDYTMAYIYKGRILVYKDEDVKTDAAKLAFEKAISLIKPEEKTSNFKSYWIEANEYLGYYFEKTGDKATAKQVFEQIKALDPTNEKAERYLNPKKQGPVAPKK